MSLFLDKLNLRPQERRLVVLIAIVLFVALNIWLVWPHFNDWQAVQTQREKTNQTLKNYQKEIVRIANYDSKLRELESAGSSVVAEGQELDLLLTVQNQARLTGLRITSNDPRPKPSTAKTNQFFEEQTLHIHANTGNDELVNFLVSLASTNSLIRVQDLSLQPATGQTRLESDLTLVASYQKKRLPPPVPVALTKGVANAAANAKPSASKTNRTVAASGTNRVAPSKPKAAAQAPLK